MGMKNRTFELTALAAALAGAYGLAQAQEQDPAITELTKPESAVSLGIGYWSDDRPKLGTYDGMREKGAYGLLDARINSRNDRNGEWFILDARRLGLDTRELRADWLRQGSGGVFLEYNRMVRDEPNTVLTNTLGVGTTTQRTPAVGSPTGSAIQLGTVREGFGAGFNKILGGGWDFRFSARSEDKTGERLWGRGGAPEFAAEPRMAHDGGRDGLEIIRKLLRQARPRLQPHGIVVIEVGGLRAAIDREFGRLEPHWLHTQDGSDCVVLFQAKRLLA